ncbi:MAG TPA: DNA repair protein RecO [Planctomycetota bacterium]|nr:DNA repair protein RecO [Planctomycetota bacterium]
MTRRHRRSTLHETDALCVRIGDFAESSAVVSLVTERLGLVRAMARGAKRVRNGFLGPLDRGVLYRVRLGRRGEGLLHLNAASVREPFGALRRDPARFHAAEMVLEVAGDLMREGEPQPDLFRLAAFSLKVLERAPGDRVALAATLFLVRAAALSGHLPEILLCVTCGEPIDDGRPLVSPSRGGALHASCAEGEPGARTVPRPVLEALEEFRRRPAAEVLRRRIPESTLRGLRLLLEEWLEHALERRFRAAPPMEREIRRGEVRGHGGEADLG